MSSAGVWSGRAALLSAVVFCFMPGGTRAEVLPAHGQLDPRVRSAAYSSDQVYRLRGYIGYAIDLEFEHGESFVGLGTGDIEGLAFVAQDNHLFLKPRAAHVRTNLTVLTSRRQYLFDYATSEQQSGALGDDVTYVLRFTYPDAASAEEQTAAEEADLRHTGRSVNVDYWYCGSASLKPVSASDDGVHTRLRFEAKGEQPAVFVENDDDTESLLNFSMDDGDVILHRVTRRLIVRRGLLSGRIVNKQFQGGGERLQSGTVSPLVERHPIGAGP
jgi:type IV secretion system protein VirB9